MQPDSGQNSKFNWSTFSKKAYLVIAVDAFERKLQRGHRLAGKRRYPRPDYTHDYCIE